MNKYLPLSSQLKKAESPFQVPATKNIGLPFRPSPRSRVQSAFFPGRTVSHPAPSCLLIGLSPGQVWLRGRGSSPSSLHWWNLYFIGYGAWKRPGILSSLPGLWGEKSKPRWPLAIPYTPESTVTQSETCCCSYPTSRDQAQADIKTESS